uniref:NADP-dependent oxidoreductase domain-containing protein n=1 Tax=Ditylenchus dipsaci TaxID=166011 RepID=A0A915EBX2_9BILA
MDSMPIEYRFEIISFTPFANAKEVFDREMMRPMTARSLNVLLLTKDDSYNLVFDILFSLARSRACGCVMFTVWELLSWTLENSQTVGFSAEKTFYRKEKFIEAIQKRRFYNHAKGRGCQTDSFRLAVNSLIALKNSNTVNNRLFHTLAKAMYVEFIATGSVVQEASIFRNYLDLVLIHYPKSSDREPEDPQNSVNRKDAWLALEKIPINRIHSIGVSNYEINHIEEIKNYGSKVPAVNQVEYTPHFRRQQLKSYCNEKGIFFQVTF